MSGLSEQREGSSGASPHRRASTVLPPALRWQTHANSCSISPASYLGASQVNTSAEIVSVFAEGNGVCKHEPHYTGPSHTLKQACISFSSMESLGPVDADTPACLSRCCGRISSGPASTGVVAKAAFKVRILLPCFVDTSQTLGDFGRNGTVVVNRSLKHLHITVEAQQYECQQIWCCELCE